MTYFVLHGTWENNLLICLISLVWRGTVYLYVYVYMFVCVCLCLPVLVCVHALAFAVFTDS